MTFTSRKIREESPSRWKTAAKATPIVAKLGAFFIAFYGTWKARKEKEEVQRTRVRILKKLAIILLAIFLGLALLVGTVQALVSLRILTLSTFLSVTGADLPHDEQGFTNFLLIGTGDKDHQGVDLTDAIIVASMDPSKTKSVVMLSIPRDLYVLDSQMMGRGRINELYRNYKVAMRRDGKTAEEASQEALRQFAVEVGEFLDMQIHHVVKVDFTAFIKVVDALGGVDIVVPEDIVDPEYPGPNYTYETFEIRAGPQHIDGETALKYARSRHTTSDFDRSARQQQLLQALSQKAKEEGVTRSPGTITSLMKILTEHVETTMTVSEILGAAKIADRIERANVISQNLNIATGYQTPYAYAGGFLYPPPREQFEGASVLLPTSIPDYPVTWRQIQTFMRLLMRYRSIYLANPPVTILNASSKTGTARMLGNELTRFGFNVESTGNASDDRRNPPRLPSTIVVAQTPEQQQFADFFAQLLQIPSAPLPSIVPAEKLGPITIIVGEDYVYKPLQDLVP